MKLAKATSGKSMLAILSSLLMALQPAWAGAPAAPIGRMSATGSAWLNGVAAPAGTNVYAGNEISTGSRAAVEVALARGGKLVLGGSTIARVSDAGKGLSVALDRGVVGVVSESRAPVVLNASGVTIRTREPAGAFQVALTGTSLLVLARQGGAMVEAANRTVEVAPGRLLEAGVAPQDPDPKKGKGSKTVLLVLTSVAVVGAAAGIALAGSGQTCEAVSPSGFVCR